MRAEAWAWDVLDWWASMSDIPLGTLLRSAIEATAAEVVEAFADELDPDLPETVLLRSVRQYIDPPPGFALPTKPNPSP